MNSPIPNTQRLIASAGGVSYHVIINSKGKALTEPFPDAKTAERVRSDCFPDAYIQRVTWWGHSTTGNMEAPA